MSCRGWSSGGQQPGLGNSSREKQDTVPIGVLAGQDRIDQDCPIIADQVLHQTQTSQSQALDVNDRLCWKFWIGWHLREGRDRQLIRHLFGDPPANAIITKNWIP